MRRFQKYLPYTSYARSDKNYIDNGALFLSCFMFVLHDASSPDLFTFEGKRLHGYLMAAAVMNPSRLLSS